LIETERLVLRPWRDEDRAPFAAINADSRVADWLGGAQARAQTDAGIERINTHIARHGYGFWAAERKADRRLVGMIGIKRQEDTPPGPCIELGWRLAHDAWGQGYATEGAAAALAWGFANIDTPELVAFTAATNLASQAVMRRIGMVHAPQRDFLHPALAADDPLRPHVMFVAVRP
jgi:RimJ/RimL family protein N-acetyltransferase